MLVVIEFQGFLSLFPNNSMIVLTLNGREIAAVVSLDETDLESLSLSLNPEFTAVIEKVRQEFAEGRSFSLEEMKREVLP